MILKNILDMKQTLCLPAMACLAIVSCSCQPSADSFRVVSPDEALEVSVEKDSSGLYVYSFSDQGEELITSSHIGFKGKHQGMIPGKDWTVSASASSHDGVWKPVWGKRQEVKDQYNELTLSFKAPEGHQGISRIQAVFRAYKDGVAFRYVVPQEAGQSEETESECTQYSFAGDYTAWFYNGEYHNLGPDKLSEVEGERQPVMTVQAGEDQFMALHEADLRTGEPLLLSSSKGDRTFQVASKPARLEPGYVSAWRVILHGRTPGEMVDSHLIELLNPEPSGDFSWVKPGTAVWDWRINGAITDDGFTYTMTYPSWVRMVDFAAEQGFKYLVLDANWYGPEFDGTSNPVSGGKTDDVRRILSYGKEKGVGIWLYLNDVGGRKYPIEETLRQYREWGAAGVKYGFMNGTPEEKNAWTRKITRLCAENRLLVDFHDGPVHPYGQMRTWPNAVTREYCQAQLDAHRVFGPGTFVTSVFVNMLAGPLDMNNGMFDLRQGNTTRVDENKPVPSTVVSEAARTLITFSGATIIPDIPEMYRKYPELLAFLSAQRMPWKESRTLMGKIGEYIVMMRETDTEYLIGAATNEEARTLSIPLTFLPEGSYTMQLMLDGEAAHYLTNRETCQVRMQEVESGDSIPVRLAPGGGACLRIKKPDRR